MTKHLKFIALFLLVACAHAHKATTKNQWIKLFNGKDLDDWIVKVHHHDAGVNFGNTFRVEDGMIKVRYDQYGDFNDQFAHLYYKEPLSHYHLKLDYHFTGTLQKGAPSYTMLNSGVMFHSQDPRSMPKEQNWPISVEMQFLADVHLLCESCKGKRFKDEVLEVTYREKSVHDVLEMSVDEAIDFF